MIEPKLLKLIERIFNLFFGASLFFSTTVLIYIGIMYITKTEEGVKKAHEKIPLLILGLALSFLSFSIPKIIKMFFQ